MVGAPQKISDIDRIGFVYYFEGFENLGFGDEFYYAMFTFNPVSSNLTNPTSLQLGLDTINYDFYFGTSPVLGESDLKISNLERPYYRESSNSIIDFVKSDGFENNIIPKSEFNEFIKGQSYYWKVVAKNIDGDKINKIESTTLPVIILSLNYKTYQEHIYTPYKDQEFEYTGIENNLEFAFFPYESSTPYDYRVALSLSSDMTSASEFYNTEWSSISSSDNPLMSLFSQMVEIGSGFDGLPSNSTVYWTVKAYSGSTEIKSSEIRSFKIIQ